MKQAHIGFEAHLVRLSALLFGFVSHTCSRLTHTAACGLNPIFRTNNGEHTKCAAKLADDALRINEFDKMAELDRSDLQKVLEQGRVSTHKAEVKAIECEMLIPIRCEPS